MAALCAFSWAGVAEDPANTEAGRQRHITAAQQALPAEPPEWTPLFQGVDLTEITQTAPLPLRVYGVRIDLTATGIRFLATPSNGDAPKETNAATTTTFLLKNRCQLAINASPFSDVVDAEGEPEDILGLSVSNGDAYSPQHPQFASLIITRGNKARVAAPPLDASDAHNAVGGFGLLMKDGDNVGDPGKRHPRTAAGVSRDGRYLYFLVIDGRQPARSAGATTAETAVWLAYLGAHEGLNLDGGGSTALVTQGAAGEPRTINTPIHNGVPGRERPVGNHLGVFAEPLTMK